MKRKSTLTPLYHGRRSTLMLLLLIGLGVLLLRAGWLEVFQQGWLKERADRRQQREVTVPPYRGMILDRQGDPVAVSSPARAVTCNPTKLLDTRDELLKQYKRDYSDRGLAREAENKFLEFEESLRALAAELGIEKRKLINRIEKFRGKHYMYLERQMEPEIAGRIMALDLPGINSVQEYRRFYPASEMFAHMVGFTNIDGHGSEGLELFMDNQLAGQAGKNRVVRDGRGRLIENVEQLKSMIPGRNIHLSVDRRIQYVAYKELKKQVYRLKAQAGAIVVLDAHTGEILAMANMPGFNPNNRAELKAWNYRNRAVTDAYEPGSVMKPFTIAAALEANIINESTQVNTSPGYIDFGEYTVRDPADLGVLSLSRVLARSSNVGASRIGLSLAPRDQWMFLSRVGFGHVPGSGFGNEAEGHLMHYKKWTEVDQASQSFGYGLSASLLQIAHAYSIFATGGMLYPVTILEQDKAPEGQRVMSKKHADAVLHMMEAVVDKRGTGARAAVEGYRIAGKTGTAYKVINKKYRKDKRIASFIGIGPVSDPQIVIAVMIDEPKLDAEGGRAAAPVFARVMRQALRVIDAVPDDYVNTMQARARDANSKRPAL